MSILLYDPGKENEPALVHYYGKIVCADASYVDGTAAGKGVTIAGNDAGVYTLSFTNGKFYSCVYANAHVIGDNADSAWVTSVNASAGTAVVSVGTTKGTPADIGAETVYVHFVFKKTSV